MINVIVCANQYGQIGYKGKLIYNIPEDMKRFKQITSTNQYNLKNFVVMGRRTFEEIGKPLPNRINIVVSSRTQEFFPKDVTVVPSLERVINHYMTGEQQKELFLLGGQQIFEEAFRMGVVDCVYLTMVHDKQKRKADTYIDLNWINNFTLIDSEKHYSDKYDCEYEFLTYIKKE